MVSGGSGERGGGEACVSIIVGMAARCQGAQLAVWRSVGRGFVTAPPVPVPTRWQGRPAEPGASVLQSADAQSGHSTQPAQRERGKRS